MSHGQLLRRGKASVPEERGCYGNKWLVFSKGFLFNREKTQGRRKGYYFRKKFNETSVVQSHSPGEQNGSRGREVVMEPTVPLTAKHLPHGKVWPRKSIALTRSSGARINRSTTREFMGDLRCSPFSQ